MSHGQEAPARMPRLDAKSASEVRETRAAQPVEATAPLALADGLTPLEVEGKHWDPIRQVMRFGSGGHWWSSRDPDAWTWAYVRDGRLITAWHGDYAMVVINHFTHAPICIEIRPANVPEHLIHEMAIKGGIANLGGAKPLPMAGDEGLSIESVFRFNTDRGIASVLPRRRQNAAEPKKPVGTAEYDEHGIPRCRQCGGTTVFVSFRVDRGRGRLWFTCQLPISPGCDKVRIMNCSKNYRRLLPLWRT